MITLLMAASKEYGDVLKLSAPNKLEYCLRWNIQLKLKSLNSKDIAMGRNKAMRNELENCDWLFFNGADTLIMNQSIDIRLLIDDQYDLIIAKDIHGINNDIFLLRSNLTSRHFLDTVMRLNWECANDQESMKEAIAEMPELRVKYVPQRLFNSYLYSEYTYPDDGGGTYQDGDFLLHLPGIPNTRRIEIMNEYLKKVIK